MSAALNRFEESKIKEELSDRYFVAVSKYYGKLLATLQEIQENYRNRKLKWFAYRHCVEFCGLALTDDEGTEDEEGAMEDGNGDEDDDSDDEPVDPEHTCHDNTNDVLHDESRRHHAHGAEPDAALGGSIGGAQVGEDER